MSKMSKGKNNYTNELSQIILDGLFVPNIDLSNIYEDLFIQEYASISDFLKHELLLKDASVRRINKLLLDRKFSLFKINLYEAMGYSLGQLLSGEFDDDYAIIKEIDKNIKEYYENR